MKNIDIARIVETTTKFNTKTIKDIARSLGVGTNIISRRLENLEVFGRESLLSNQNIPGYGRFVDQGIAPATHLKVSEIPNYRKYSEVTVVEAARIIASRYNADAPKQNLRAFYIANGIDANTFNRWLREISVYGTLYGTRVVPKKMRHYSASMVLRHFKRYQKSVRNTYMYCLRNDIRRDESLSMMLTGKIIYNNLVALSRVEG
jgi:hypothetical protein